MREAAPKDFAPLKISILEALCKTKMSDYEHRIFNTVFRKTFGWSDGNGGRKTEDYISLSQYAKSTGMRESHASRTEKILLQRKILTKGGKFVGINKQVGEWQNLPKGVNTHHAKNLPKGVNRLTKGGKKNLPKGGYTKEKKETYTKEIIHRQQSCPEANEIVKFYKDTYGFKKTIPKQLENWRAAKWLYEQYGVEKTCQAILAAKSALEDSVNGTDNVPLVKNLMDLKDKYEQLRYYYGKKRARSGIIAI